MTPAELRALALDPEACIKGTPMIPLHRDTLLSLLDERDRMQRVIDEAKAMRNAGVSIGQRVILPDSAPDSMADDTALGWFIGLFDGPLQRTFDAALAELEGKK